MPENRIGIKEKSLSRRNLQTSDLWGDIEHGAKVNISTFGKDVSKIDINELAASAGFSIEDTRLLFELLSGAIKDPNKIIPVLSKFGGSFVKDNKSIIFPCVAIKLEIWIIEGASAAAAATACPALAVFIISYASPLAGFNADLIIDSISGIPINDSYIWRIAKRWFPNLEAYQPVIDVALYLMKTFGLKDVENQVRTIAQTTDKIEDRPTVVDNGLPVAWNNLNSNDKETLRQFTGMIFNLVTPKPKKELTKEQQVLLGGDSRIQWNNFAKPYKYGSTSLKEFMNESVPGEKLRLASGFDYKMVAIDTNRDNITFPIYFKAVKDTFIVSLLKKLENDVYVLPRNIDFTPYKSLEEGSNNIAHYLTVQLLQWYTKTFQASLELNKHAQEFFNYNPIYMKLIIVNWYWWYQVLEKTKIIDQVYLYQRINDTFKNGISTEYYDYIHQILMDIDVTPAKLIIEVEIPIPDKPEPEQEIPEEIEQEIPEEIEQEIPDEPEPEQEIPEEIEQEIEQEIPEEIEQEIPDEPEPEPEPYVPPTLEIIDEKPPVKTNASVIAAAGVATIGLGWLFWKVLRNL